MTNDLGNGPKPIGTASSSERPPSCVSLKSLKGYLPRGPGDSMVGMDRRKGSFGSAISHKTGNRSFMRSIGNLVNDRAFKDSASKENSIGEDQKSDDAPIRL